MQVLKEGNFLYIPNNESNEKLRTKLLNSYGGIKVSNKDSIRIHVKYEAAFKTYMLNYMYENVEIVEHMETALQADAPVQSGTLTLDIIAQVMAEATKPISKEIKSVDSRVYDTNVKVSNVVNSVTTLSENVRITSASALDATSAVKTLTSKVAELESKLEAITSVIYNVTVCNKTTEVNIGRQHKKFKFLVELCSKLPPTMRNIWLAGPAGSGKTTAARNLATVLGVDFHFNGPLDTPYKVSGFTDAKGDVVRTAFYKAWTNGGVYLADDADASSNSALLEWQAALANGIAMFPDGHVERHPDFYFLFSANTWGHGATAQYVGRAKIDAAYLNRFYYVDWQYDEELENLLTPNKEWLAVVQNTRKLILESGAQMIVSPRQSIAGSSLLDNGMSKEDVVEAIFGNYVYLSAWPSVSKYVDSFLKNKTTFTEGMSKLKRLEFVSAGDSKIDAIRVVRDLSGLCVVDAKEVVENYQKFWANAADWQFILNNLPYRIEIRTCF